MNEITINELFSGIGAVRKAFIILGISHRVVGISEIDKYAIASYKAMYGDTFNYGDISKVDKLKYADLWVYGFPCQDISVAGNMQGIVKGKTRSGLLFEVERVLETAVTDGEPPKYLLMENVKNLVGKRFKPDFDRWLQKLDDLGYHNYWKVLDAQNFGIPQHRERVFCVSIRKDLKQGFEFPDEVTLTTCMQAYLESEVDDKYFIAQLTADKLIKDNARQAEKGNGFRFAPLKASDRSVASTVTTRADRRESNWIDYGETTDNDRNNS
jgi:DNA (cytosine-5)-methyltransferase 1